MSSSATKLNFHLDQVVVYPSHGVGRVTDIVDEEIVGMSMKLYVIEFEKDRLQLKVPIAKASSVGMRPVASPQEMDVALRSLQGRAKSGRGIWSRRAQELDAKINSGDLGSLAEVVRDLHRVDSAPSASYSERQLYEAAFGRMAREVCAVRSISQTEAFRLMESMLEKGAKKREKDTEVETEAEAA